MTTRLLRRQLGPLPHPSSTDESGGSLRFGTIDEPSRQPRQMAAQNRGLQFIQPAVVSQDFVLIAPALSIEPQHAGARVAALVVSENCSAVADGAEVFGGVETSCRNLSNSARSLV